MDANVASHAAQDETADTIDPNAVDPADVARSASAMIDEAEKDFTTFCKTNPEVEKRSLKIVQDILKRLHTAMTKLNELKSIERENYYHITYNGSI
jgi:hypothetical protein